MIHTFLNSGVPEQVEFSEKTIEEVYIPLLRRLTALQKEKGCRILVLLAAPPGAGKSTLADLLRYLSVNTPGLTEVTSIGMDGFHRYQAYLLSHETERDGVMIPMVSVKGAPETFDLELLTARIRQLKTEPAVGWPAYDRLLHDPVEDAVRVEGDIVLLEGNYLLLEEPGWADLRRYADLTIRLTAEEALLRERLVKRKISTGVTREEAERFVDFSDMYNVRLCLRKTGSADLEIASI